MIAPREDPLRTVPIEAIDLRYERLRLANPERVARLRCL